MIDSLLSLPLLVGCLIFTGLTTVVGLAVYSASFRLLTKGQPEGELREIREATGNLFRVVGWLVSLLLSLTFAEVLREWTAIDTAIEGEASSILDTHDDLRRFGREETREIRELLIGYTHGVIEDDWPALADDKLDPRTDDLLRQMNDAIFKLEANDPASEHLRSRIVAGLDLASDYRLSRLQQAQESPPFFMIVVLLGYLITMTCFGVYRPQRNLILLVSTYTLFVGVVMYLILAMSDPFQGTLAVENEPIQYVLEKIESS